MSPERWCMVMTALPRLSTWLWQPDGFDVPPLAVLRAPHLTERNREGVEIPDPPTSHEFGYGLPYSRQQPEPIVGGEPEPEPEPELELVVGRRSEAETSGWGALRPTAAPVPSLAKTYNTAWLLVECEQSLVAMGLNDATELQAAELAISTKQLISSSRGDDEIQGELASLLGFDRFDFIVELLSNRRAISKMSVPTQAKKLLKSVEKQRCRQPTEHEDAVGEQSHQQFVDMARRASTMQPSSRAPLKKLGFSDGVDAVMGGTAMPAGTEEIQHQRYRQVNVPAPSAEKVAEARSKAAGNVKGDVELVEVSSLPSFVQKALSPVRHLNRLQSACFEAAFNNADNMLVCAPTGSGKTNVALLTLLREVSRHSEQLGAGKSPNVWPM